MHAIVATPIAARVGAFASARPSRSSPVRAALTPARVSVADTTKLGSLKGLRGSGTVGVRRAARPGSVAVRASAAAAAPAGTPAPEEKVSLIAIARAQLFYVVTFFLALPLFAMMTVMFPLTYLTDKYRRYALSFVNDLWAIVSCRLFTNIEVIGRENLPAPNVGAVYVANHASYLDIYSLFHLRRPFKFISKVSNFIIPIIGWSMYMTGHIALKRTDRKSQMKTLKDCRTLLQNDCPVLFFPEGTRSPDGQMGDFKKGAFSVAAKEKALVVPITLVGTGDAMGIGKEWMLRNKKIKVIVHKAVVCEDAQKCCDDSYKTIKEALVQHS